MTRVHKGPVPDGQKSTQADDAESNQSKVASTQHTGLFSNSHEKSPAQPIVSRAEPDLMRGSGELRCLSCRCRFALPFHRAARTLGE